MSVWREGEIFKAEFNDERRLEIHIGRYSQIHDGNIYHEYILNDQEIGDLRFLLAIIDRVKTGAKQTLPEPEPAKPWEEHCDDCDSGLNLAPGTCGACGRIERHRCKNCDRVLDDTDLNDFTCHHCGFTVLLNAATPPPAGSLTHAQMKLWPMSFADRVKPATNPTGDTND